MKREDPSPQGGDPPNILVGSSEITCEKCYNDKFIYWLIGFTEGDGSFIVNKNESLEFKVTQSFVDVQVLYYIKRELEFGKVSVQDKKNNTYHYRVRDKKGLLNIINIFNGNLYLPKKQVQLKKFLESYNKYYKTDIILKENKLKPSFNNGWLSGFIDAEGCFYCYYKDKSKFYKYNKVSLRVIISQQECLEIIEELNKLLKGSITYQKSYNGYNITVGIRNIYNIEVYLEEYTLKTKKIKKYKSFINIFKLIEKKVHLTEKGYLQIKKLIDKFKKL